MWSQGDSHLARGYLLCVPPTTWWPPYGIPELPVCAIRPLTCTHANRGYTLTAVNGKQDPKPFCLGQPAAKVSLKFYSAVPVPQVVNGITHAHKHTQARK